ncbi:MAG: hypothetical protein WAO98_08010 [Alphaproteobacteria bacterium]
MSDFDSYLMRHSEFGVQALIERLERYEGIRTNISVSLEDRWNHLMHSSAPQSLAA